MSGFPDAEAQERDGGYREIAVELVLAKEQAARAEAELRAIRGSTSWRLTAPLRAIVVWLKRGGGRRQAEPRQDRLEAPARLPSQLHRQQRSLAASDASARVVDGRPLLAEILPPGFEAILDGQGDLGWRQAGIRVDMANIAVWGSVEFCRELALCMHVTWLDAANWMCRLDETMPDFVLLVPDTRSNGWGVDSWADRLVESCGERKIPVAVWIWDCEDASVLPLARCADAVFVLCDSAREKIASLLPGKEVFIFPLAIAPELYNPIRTPELKRLASGMKGVAISDTLSEVLEQSEALLGQDSLLFCESYWDMPASRLANEMNGRGNVLGVLRPEDKIALWKAGAREVLSESAHKPAWWDAQQALRIAACGARFQDGAANLPGIGGIEEPVASLARLQAMADAHRAMRDAMQSGLAARISGMGKHFGIEVSARGHASNGADDLVSCLFVSKRPELASAVVDSMLAQTYGNLEVVLVLHGVGDNLASVFEGRHYGRVRVLAAPAHWSLGRCLNEAFAVSSGSYWLKIDDDDVYGMHYVQDMMLHAGHIDYDLIGKPLVFTLFEQDDALYFDPEMIEFSNTIHRGGWPPGAVCGATLGGRRGVLERQGFPAHRRHGVDSLFLDACAGQGFSLLVADPFGFTCARDAASRSHTWIGNESAVRERGIRLGGRAAIETWVNQ